ncbi:protamine-like protein 99C, partial [Drosophila takahashii]|uniref:protamine-like protein 99C n=1 Tax=Drosophila takahashii TaxID=29030 RepID=UPI003898E421
SANYEKKNPTLEAEDLLKKSTFSIRRNRLYTILEHLENKNLRVNKKHIIEGKKRGKVHCEPVYKYQKVARLTRNGYLNILRDYKRLFCGILPQDMVRFGARQWNQLSLDEMKRFKTMGPSQKFESPSNKESTGESKRGKLCQKRLEGRERISSRSKKSQLKKRDSNPLGSAIAYIHFMRKFQKKNPNLEAKDLLKKATHMWFRLQGHKRQQIESPLWIVKTG